MVSLRAGATIASVLATALGAGCGGATVAVGTKENAAEPVAEPEAEPEPSPGDLARQRAEQAAADERWADAASGFEQAYQLLDDPQMLFESALAFTKAGQWSAAADKLETYLVADRKDVDPARASAVQAEIDRLRSLAAGQEPVTADSLADRIYAERAGPPSLPAGASEGSGATLEDLLFYAGSKRTPVRLRAVRDLAAQPSDRARLALEERVLTDTNISVRIAAAEALVARGSVASLPVLERALVTATTSQERAVLKRAVAELHSRVPY